MLHLTDLFPETELEAAIASGYVRVQSHPSLPLRIYNYTEKAQYAHYWTPVTRTCRGLIVDADGTVVARPFLKFFNYGEADAGDLRLNQPCIVTDKLDGSLGIIYPTPDGPAVATRGSFTSEQAVHATAVLRDRYGSWAPREGMTCLVEIIYPANRIVVDYQGLDDLCLIGQVDNATGVYRPRLPADWPGLRAQWFSQYQTLAQALVARDRDGREGLVCTFEDGTMLKLKQEEYVRLHRILTGLTARTLWEYAAVNDCPARTARDLARHLHLPVERVEEIRQAGPNWLQQLLEATPEEFQDWVHQTIARLYGDAFAIYDGVCSAAAVYRNTPRREVAAELAGNAYRGLVFNALDGCPFVAQLWRHLYPPHERPFDA